MKNVKRITMEFWCGVGNLKESDAWADSELLNNPDPHLDTCEIFNKSEEEVENILLNIVKDKYDFEPVSEEGEEIAIEILNDLSELLLNEEITPRKFCLVVSRLEANFIDFRRIDERTFEYPPWLGDLWNQCDWCDESWTNSNSPHLISEVNKMLSINKKKNNV